MRKYFFSYFSTNTYVGAPKAYVKIDGQENIYNFMLKHVLMCLAQGHNVVPLRLEPATDGSRVLDFTTEPLIIVGAECVKMITYDVGTYRICAKNSFKLQCSSIQRG